ncbi:MAG: GNAT family N-acetyltransferase [Candidatus Diapherotrites archaeon]|uniref:GNAT family N-acetyltransferase n=1 Tax=Candidatus Iainarchaeum sp. TaxID=3101447 RepID=A0A7J4KTM8_9ARCH|nr:GNAT family N-acetyltransferase [Candidatus Diapherotrites archaeon]HIH21577.1 GNAT family N-acetyltransferase [Candidatus Diapherotrites archaeon]HIH33272.1 GNAT family N-acetyltransferase [Candidatus Diapherotrites archaeon]
MRIEKASEKDAELISRMISSEFPYTEANPENLKKRMQRQNIRLFKAVEEGKIVGFIELEFLDNLFGVWRINGIAVEEKHRKKGFGKKLAEFGVEFAKEQNALELVLLVSLENKAAKKIYQNLGFKKKGLWKSKVGGKKAEEWSLQLEDKRIA